MDRLRLVGDHLHSKWFIFVTQNGAAIACDTVVIGIIISYIIRNVNY